MSQIGRHPENTSKQRRKRARHCERGMGERRSRGIYIICTNYILYAQTYTYGIHITCIYIRISIMYTHIIGIILKTPAGKRGKEQEILSEGRKKV